MLPPSHPYLENTIASMKAAFQVGADIVEFDIQPTKDGQFAVFHDGNLVLIKLRLSITIHDLLLVKQACLHQSVGSSIG